MGHSHVTGRGDPVLLGEELARGGEGYVVDIPASPGRVAKLYHQVPTLQKQAKLRFMAAATDERLLKYTAWPTDTLHDSKGGPVLGFIMPRVVGFLPVHMLYSPAHRRKEFPRAQWEFLIYAARNIAAAFATVHSHGHIVGDVNQGNVLVGTDSKVTLIDCDSFQISSNGSQFLCEVGVSHFTPPELQGLTTFDGFRRTIDHDNFGLGLLIFHTLLGGRHPYSGVPVLDGVGDALEANIKSFLYAYARDNEKRGIKPPPQSIPLSILPVSMLSMFERAFTESGVHYGRPSAEQWVHELDTLLKRLKRCSRSAMHVYPDHSSHCPWCKLDGSGIVYFQDLGPIPALRSSSFSLDQAWAAIESIPSPPVATIPDFKFPGLLVAKPLPSGVPSGTQIAFLRAVVIIIGIGVFVAAPWSFIFVVVGIFVGIALADQVGEPARSVEKASRRDARDCASAEYDELVRRFRQSCGPEKFVVKKSELASLRVEYRGLEERERTELDNLHSTAKSRQKARFLESFFIDSADIAGLGPAKKAALRSFGIETAADVEWNKVISVRGFGEVYTRAVVDWRKSCERRFVFNPQIGVTEVDKNFVRRRVADRRSRLELLLLNGPLELDECRRESESNVSRLTAELKNTMRKVKQAEADLSVL